MESANGAPAKAGTPNRQRFIVAMQAQSRTGALHESVPSSQMTIRPDSSQPSSSPGLKRHECPARRQSHGTTSPDQQVATDYFLDGTGRTLMLRKETCP